ncbi:MAG TPA: S24 family peptidase [Nitrospiraceae bacterium]|nr:S24 family peptidase [Nitrospiraceae bacterium]
MNLKDLVYRELGEGLTEEELASAVGVSVRTIENILADEVLQNPVIWGRFARYFRIHPDILRSGGPPHSEGLFELTEDSLHSPAGRMRKVPLLKWDQIDQMVTYGELPRLIRAEALLETDVPGRRIFALKVKDNSMQPLFNEGETFFVNPDLPGEPGHYVVVESKGDGSGRALLRQLKKIGGRSILHPINRSYHDLPVTKRQRIRGRVVRLRKNL